MGFPWWTLAADGDGDDLAPLADGGVVHVEDASVLPLSEDGGLGMGVGAAGGGVEGEGAEAVPVSAINLKLGHVEEPAVPLPGPVDPDAYGSWRRPAGWPWESGNRFPQSRDSGTVAEALRKGGRDSGTAPQRLFWAAGHSGPRSFGGREARRIMPMLSARVPRLRENQRAQPLATRAPAQKGRARTEKGRARTGKRRARMAKGHGRIERKHGRTKKGHGRTEKRHALLRETEAFLREVGA